MGPPHNQSSARSRHIPQRASTPLRVGLLWHAADSPNLGLGALTIANAALTRTAAARAGREVEFLILGWRGGGDVYPSLADVPTVHIDSKQLVSPRGYASAVRRCGLVIDIGGGDSLSDIYGRRRLGFLLATKAIALAMRVPLVLGPQTIGPFQSQISRRTAEGLIASSRAAFARDPLSRASVGWARAAARVHLTSDVAFALSYSRPTRGGTDTTRVAINPSGLLFRGGYKHDNAFGLETDYPVFLERIVQYFAGLSNTEVVLVPHVIAPGSTDDDWELSRDLAHRYGFEPPERFHDPVAAKSFISGCDFLVGSRMHACIAAVSSGVATVPVAYSRKFAGLFDAIGYEHTVDARSASTEDAVAGVIAGFHARAELRTQAAQASANADSRLEQYVSTMTEVLSAIP